MTPDETEQVWAAVMQVCPSQRFDDHTPEAWHFVLGDLDHGDAITAVRSLARRLRYIGTSDICGEVAAIRDRRLDAAKRGGDIPWPEGVSLVEHQRDVLAVADGRAVVVEGDAGRRVEYVTGLRAVTQ